jgi:hypothetical protein
MSMMLRAADAPARARAARWRQVLDQTLRPGRPRYGRCDPRTAPAVADTATTARPTNQARRYHGGVGGDGDGTGGGSWGGPCRGAGSHNETCSIVWHPPLPGAATAPTR